MGSSVGSQGGGGQEMAFVRKCSLWAQSGTGASLFLKETPPPPLFKNKLHESELCMKEK